MKNAHREPVGAEQLVEDAQALLSDTAHIAEEKVMEARKRLLDAVEEGKILLGNMKDRAVAGAKATDKTIRSHPYQTIGIALGVGLLVGYLYGRRK